MALCLSRVGIAGLMMMMMLMIGASGCGNDDVKLSIAVPSDNQTVSFPELRVSGTVEPESATVRVEDKLVRTRNGIFTTTVTLHRGRNRINIAASSSGRASDVREIVVKRGTTRAEFAAASRRRIARRAAAAARAEIRARRARSTPTGQFSESFRERFMASCQLNGSATQCSCGLRYLERRASLEDLEQARNEIAQGRAPKLLVDGIAACRSS